MAAVKDDDEKQQKGKRKRKWSLLTKLIISTAHPSTCIPAGGKSTLYSGHHYHHIPTTAMPHLATLFQNLVSLATTTTTEGKGSTALVTPSSSGTGGGEQEEGVDDDNDEEEAICWREATLQAEEDMGKDPRIRAKASELLYQLLLQDPRPLTNLRIFSLNRCELSDPVVADVAAALAGGREWVDDNGEWCRWLSECRREEQRGCRPPCPLLEELDFGGVW